MPLPNEIEKQLFLSIRPLLKKRQQGYIMGAFRENKELMAWFEENDEKLLRLTRFVEVMQHLGTILGLPAGSDLLIEVMREVQARVQPIDMVLRCPNCDEKHIDKPDPSMLAEDAAMLGGDWPGHWTNPPHRSHLCKFCGTIWRPADFPTNGVGNVKTRGQNDTWKED